MALKNLIFFNKGHIPWNKGLRRPEISGDKHPMWGKHHTLAAKTAMSDKRKKYFLDPEHLKRKSETARTRRGENAANWRGGVSRSYKEGYWSPEYKFWRTAVFERDGWECQHCHGRGSKIYLTAHHIKSWKNYPELRFIISNGVTLCEDCHELTDNYRGRNRGKNL
jgi:5-methylcytosine-specific restriction endonuclease McrA